MKAVFKKVFAAAIPFCLIAALIVALAVFPKEAQAQKQQCVVRVWNVDTFEGGRGSRTSFLRGVARTVEKTHAGVYYLISSYTLEGARAAYAAREAPDMISFGLGAGFYAEMSLPFEMRFAGGEVGGETLAIPWCRGKYALFCLEDDFEKQGAVAVSSGGENLSALAARLAGIAGEEVESQTAYTQFLSGKYRYLLGTQRDICRFQTRGVQVFEKELGGYNDLYQVVSVLSKEKRTACLDLVAELLSEETQDSLEKIGMLPVKGDESGRTVSVFSDAEALRTLRELARGENVAKNLDNFLKTI